MTRTAPPALLSLQAVQIGPVLRVLGGPPGPAGCRRTQPDGLPRSVAAEHKLESMCGAGASATVAGALAAAAMGSASLLFYCRAEGIGAPAVIT